MVGGSTTSREQERSNCAISDGNKRRGRARAGFGHGLGGQAREAGVRGVIVSLAFPGEVAVAFPGEVAVAFPGQVDVPVVDASATYSSRR